MALGFLNKEIATMLASKFGRVICRVAAAITVLMGISTLIYFVQTVAEISEKGMQVDMTFATFMLVTEGSLIFCGMALLVVIHDGKKLLEKSKEARACCSKCVDESTVPAPSINPQNTGH
jgi:hypothetical protein